MASMAPVVLISTALAIFKASNLVFVNAGCDAEVTVFFCSRSRIDASFDKSSCLAFSFSIRSPVARPNSWETTPMACATVLDLLPSASVSETEPVPSCSQALIRLRPSFTTACHSSLVASSKVPRPTAEDVFPVLSFTSCASALLRAFCNAFERASWASDSAFNVLSNSATAALSAQASLRNVAKRPSKSPLPVIEKASPPPVSTTLHRAFCSSRSAACCRAMAVAVCSSCR
mmetsp:Transcript_5492/g.13838  ORF Transcript_5492/g.13838 Transcript_5492/m.13838 type:complete len:232 (-) Transcript_5492:1347-2042(-)